jgi:hypothetical protein
LLQEISQFSTLLVFWEINSTRNKNEKIFLSQSPQGSQRRQKYRIQVSGIRIQAMTPVSFSPLCEPCEL